MPFEARVKATIKEGGGLALVGAGAVAAQHFLYRDTFFEKKINPSSPDYDPNFTSKFIYLHWGGIQLVGFAYLATYIKNPYVKLVVLGAALAGGIQEIRQLTISPKTGLTKIPQIGSAETDKLNEELRQAAMGAPHHEVIGEAIVERYSSAVGALDEPIVNRYGSAVGATPMMDEFSTSAVGF